MRVTSFDAALLPARSTGQPVVVRHSAHLAPDFDVLAARLDRAAEEGVGDILTGAIRDAVEDGTARWLEPRRLRRLGKGRAAGAGRFAEALAGAVEQSGAAGEMLAPDIRRGLIDQVGRTALMLSGGGKLGNYHVGVVATLHARGLLPETLSGASAGALIAAIVGTRTDADLSAMLADGGRAMVADSMGGASDQAAMHLSQHALGRYIARVLPDVTFAQARRRSGRTISIVVASASAGGGGAILNADTTPHLLVRDAVLASCAIPFVYSPVCIRERPPGGRQRLFQDGARWVDGSVWADLPAQPLRSHHDATRLVASVVNPFELPFLLDPVEHGDGLHLLALRSFGLIRACWAGMIGAAAQWLPQPAGLTMLDLWQQLLKQQVEADVIIVPAERLQNLRSLLDHATLPQLLGFVAQGQAATRERMWMIEPMLRLERALRGTHTGR